MNIKKDLLNIKIDEFNKEYENKLNIINGNKKKKKEIDDDLSKAKEENCKLNLQKKFLINELTKSIYNNENLRTRYKNELDRLDSYLKKIKYDLKGKSIEYNI